MHFCKKFSFFTHINFCEKKEHRAFTFHTFDQPIYHPNVDLCESFGTFLSCVHRNQTVSHSWSVWIDISLAQKAPFQPSITFKSGWLCKCSVFTYLSFMIICQTHYEKSDWSRAFNQFTIACELDMINAISAADIAFIMSSSMSAWLPSPLECSPQKQNGWTETFN